MPTYGALKANYIELRVNIEGLHKEEAERFGEFIKNRINDMLDGAPSWSSEEESEACYPNSVVDITYEVK